MSPFEHSLGILQKPTADQFSFMIKLSTHSLVNTHKNTKPNVD